MSSRIFLITCCFASITARAATFTVVNTNDSGAGSLRQAIFDANATPGANVIGFNVPAITTAIFPSSPLPEISNKVVIDGTTQPGYSGSPLIEIVGLSAGAAADGLRIRASNCVVRSLAINRFGNNAISIFTNGSGRVENCYLGLATDGLTARSNLANGISITDSANNVVSNNVICANIGNGVEIIGASSSNNVVLGNYIGVDATGTNAVGNRQNGIRINFPPYCTVGGVTASTRNVISGNGQHGIAVGGGSDHLILGNLIGTDVTGTRGIANFRGISIGGSSRNIIGGTVAGAGNVISSNVSNGIVIIGSGTANKILGNKIGTDITGTQPLGNQLGISIAISSGNEIGGTSPGAGNIVAFNRLTGISVAGSTQMTNAIRHNQIFFNAALGIDFDTSGVNPNDAGDADTGSNGRQNFPLFTGVTNYPGLSEIRGTLNSTANATFAIDLFASAACDSSGYGEGQLYLGSTNVTTDGAGNATFVVSFSSLPATHQIVTATATDAAGNTSEFSPCQAAVFWRPNAPVLTAVTNHAGSSEIRGTLSSIANAAFVIDLFANTSCDASGNGTGRIFLGSTNVMTDEGGYVSFVASVPPLPFTHPKVNARATAAPGNVSFYSLCINPIYPGPRTLSVVNTNDSGPGSLRQALLDNNVTSGGTNLVQFNIPGAGVQTIAPVFYLPYVTHPVVIDGLTQPGSSANTLATGNNAALKIRLDGSKTFGTSALQIETNGCEIRGLIIVNWKPNGYGVFVKSGTGSVIEGCFIGLEADGSATGPNASGIAIGSYLTNPSPPPAKCRIGGSTPATRNLISGNLSYGIVVGYGFEHRILGNYIGTDASGMAARGQAAAGIYLHTSHFDVIGGTNAVERNLICANGEGITQVGSYSNSVLGNYIGVNVTGNGALGNINAAVSLSGGGANLIGAPGAANILSGNKYGLTLSETVGNMIQGNRIGVSSDGMNAVSNRYYGVSLVYASDTQIGGSDPGEGNQISGNRGAGLQFYCCGATNNRVQGNLIGTDATGASPLGNGFAYGEPGIEIDSSGNMIGGPNASVGNVIAFNAGAGVRMLVSILPPVANPILHNSIFSNGSLGIDLHNFSGVTLNDAGDTDTGANELQNFPLLSAVRTPTNVTVFGTLNSHSNSLYRLDFYGNGASDSSGYGEGETWLGTTDVTTDGSGNTAFTIGFSGVANSARITATATDTNGNTSEFSAATAVNTNGITDLVLIRQVSAESIPAGQVLQYTIIASNAGPETATGAQLSFSLGGVDVTILSATNSQGTLGDDGPYWSARFGTIAVGATATLVVTVIPTEIGTLQDTGYLYLNQFDPVSSNSSSVGSVSVVEGPGLFRIVFSGLGLRENEGPAIITVERIGGAAGTVSVEFATSNLTATAGSDYTAAAGTLIFTNGETTKSFSIVVNDDLISECNEGLNLHLFNPTGGASVLQPDAELTIIENDFDLAGTIEALSLDTNVPPRTAHDHSFDPLISSNGLFVAFSSYADTLITNGLNSIHVQVYVRNIAAAQTRLVSGNTNGVRGNGSAHLSGISADGRFVLFFSYASDLVAFDTNGTADIFLRDTVSNTTRLVSVNRTGVGVGNGYSIYPRMTPDARFIVFYSAARDLVAHDANGRVDVFLRDMNSNVVELISVNQAGSASANDDSYPDGISHDGRYVAFDSYATDLNDADTTERSDFYVRDRLLGTNILCSVTASGSGGNDESYLGQLSANGSAVVFSSYASDLVSGDTNGERDIFTYDLASGQVQLVSANASGTGSGNLGSSGASISTDGRYVVFSSDATDLVTNALAGLFTDIFVRDLIAQATTLVSVNCHGDRGGNDLSYDPAFSADGRFIVFSSYASDLLPGGFMENEDKVYRYDRLTGITDLLSFNHQRTGAGNSYNSRQAISGNGRSVAFASTASNLIASDANGSIFDIFLWREMSSVAQLSISFTTIAGGAASLSVSGEPGTLYVVERTATFAAPISWTPIGMTNAPADGYFQFVDPTPPAGGAFYRVAQP